MASSIFALAEEDNPAALLLSKRAHGALSHGMIFSMRLVSPSLCQMDTFFLPLRKADSIPRLWINASQLCILATGAQMNTCCFQKKRGKKAPCYNPVSTYGKA